MREDKEEQYRCDECRKNLTDKRHIRILLGFTSGWMAPPFFAGKPVAEICARNPEYHFCSAEHFTLFFNRKLNELEPNTARSPRRSHGAPAVWPVLEETGTSGPSVPGKIDVGTRALARGEEGQRDVGFSEVVRIRALAGPVHGHGDTRQGNQPVDSAESYRELGRSGKEVLAHLMATRPSLLERLVRPLAAVRRGIISVLP